MFKIGNVNIESKVVLAPMAGVTSFAYRNFMKHFGVGLSVTEMVSDCGLIYGNRKTLDYIRTSEEERPVAIQLFGGDADNMCKAIDIIFEHNKSVDIIDVNLGCPVPKVVKCGAGSALLKDSEKLKEYMSKIVKHSPVPVTAKIRLGWDDDNINFIENIKALEESGVAAIAIHARTRAQMYSGRARYIRIKGLRSQMKVPLIVSGDIYTLDDAINAIDITGADAVMVARGGVGNPMLVKQIDTYYKTLERVQDATLEESINYLLDFTKMLIEEKDEYHAMAILRGIAPKFFDKFPGMKKYKNNIAMNLSTYASLEKILTEIKSNI